MSIINIVLANNKDIIYHQGIEITKFYEGHSLCNVSLSINLLKSLVFIKTKQQTQQQQNTQKTNKNPDKIKGNKNHNNKIHNNSILADHL